MAEQRKTRVARGAARLDALVPGWYKRIDAKRLEIDSDTHCVLGQLFDGYPFKGLAALGIASVQADRFGFCRNRTEPEGCLEPHWLSAVAARRELDPPRERIGALAKQAARKKPARRRLQRA